MHRCKEEKKKERKGKQDNRRKDNGQRNGVRNQEKVNKLHYAGVAAHAVSNKRLCELGENLRKRFCEFDELKRNKNSGRWSTMAIVNMFLFLCILGASGTTLYVYTEGNLTQDSIAKAIPKIQENAIVLAALTKEAFQPDNLKQTGLLMVQAVSDLASEVWEGLQVYTGDLSIYTEPIAKGFSDAWNWTYNTISKLEWDVIVSYVKSVITFIHEQWLVFCEELGKNEAFKSAMAALIKHTAGLREFMSIYLDMAAKQLTVAVEYIQQEGPVILASVREQAAIVFDGAKQQIEGLMK
ncbi:unnamed protein product, partial [Meganyctiphanes norvegica]